MRENKIDNIENNTHIPINTNYKKNNTNIWIVINIITFIISIVALIIGSFSFKCLFGMNEYEMGISMIFLFPLILGIIGIYSVYVGIVTFVTTVISMIKIILKNNKTISYVCGIIEALCYLFVIITLVK